MAAPASRYRRCEPPSTTMISTLRSRNGFSACSTGPMVRAWFCTGTMMERTGGDLRDVGIGTRSQIEHACSPDERSDIRDICTRMSLRSCGLRLQTTNMESATELTLTARARHWRRMGRPIRPKPGSFSAGSRISKPATRPPRLISKPLHPAGLHAQQAVKTGLHPGAAIGPADIGPGAEIAADRVRRQRRLDLAGYRAGSRRRTNCCSGRATAGNRRNWRSGNPSRLSRSPE